MEVPMALAYTQYAQHVAVTPQSQPIPGREPEMVQNNAGGYGFVLDDWERLNRFLIVGSTSGTYYVGEQKLTVENAGAAIRCIKADGPRAVAMAHDVNANNRAPKTDQQLFVLALAMKHGDDATKVAAAAAAPAMLRTGTHLLHFVAMLDGLGGWNRSKRRIIASWFTGQDADHVAFQVLKYQNRDGWTQRDVLRVAHPKGSTEAHDAIFAWAAGKLTDDEASHLPAILTNHRAMLAMDGTPVERALWGIQRGLPREALPTEAVNDPTVQCALLPTMPLHALLRNLGNLSASGVLGTGDAAAIVAQKLTDKTALRRARVHPFAVLLAALIYRTGAGVRGSKTWVPVQAVLSALEDAYDLAFDAVEPTGKRILITIDTSGSMGGGYGQTTPIKPIEMAAAMAVTLARLEPNAVVIEVDTELRRIVPITKRTGIASIQHHRGGGTDMSIPMLWARTKGVVRGKMIEPQFFDAFVILTDNESWAGHIHTAQALSAYRQSANRRAKLICCAMTASHANIVDPEDPLQFGCAGLDANLPVLVGDFIGR
jgi:60 kDa SS-A/Ro ribonucleoprotein